jgi:DNA-binding transcriptional LysR family regulator
MFESCRAHGLFKPFLVRYFLAVAEELHFGRAAARLYISQPSLSNKIRKFERKLGTPLFVRTSRQVELTAAGRALLEEAPTALAALGRASERTRFAGAGIVETLRLGYTPMTSFDTLPALLTAVENENPELTVVAREKERSSVRGFLTVCSPASSTSGSSCTRSQREA